LAHQEPPSITGGLPARRVIWGGVTSGGGDVGPGPSPGGAVRQGADLPWVHALHERLRDGPLRAVDPNPKYGLVARHLRFLFRYCIESTVTSRARPDVRIWSLSNDLLRVRHVSRARPATSGAWRPRRSTRVPRSPRLQASGVLGRPARDRVPRGPGRGQPPDHRAGLFRGDSCRSHPGYMPFIVASTGHAETYAEGQHLREDSRPLNTHWAPDGPCPRSRTKSRAVRQRGALRHPHR